MNTKTYYLFSGLSLLGGCLFFAYMQEWIILRIPYQPNESKEACHNLEGNHTKKKVKLSYWHKGKWHTEQQELIWSNDKTATIHYLINSLLTLLDEEMVMDKKVTLQTVLLASADNEAYLSFDQNPLPTESSTFAQWMWIEGVLKTIRDNGIALRTIHFLVHHQPLSNDHLDFGQGWPLAGFLS